MPPSSTSKRSTTGDEHVVVGHIAGAYGIKGWVRIGSYTVPPENLLEYQPWLVGGKPLQVLDVHAHGAGFVAQLRGVTDRDVAASMAGTQIAVLADVLPILDEDEFYWRDLLGLIVVNVEGATLGKVTGFLASGANDVMVVRDEEIERLVPFAGSIVVSVERGVDRASGRIVVDWGLDY